MQTIQVVTLKLSNTISGTADPSLPSVRNERNLLGFWLRNLERLDLQEIPSLY